MWGHWGFSYIGLIFVCMLLVPNALWAAHRPVDYTPQGEPRMLLAMERMGQVGVTATALCYSDFNPHALSPWSLWLLGSCLLMLLYELWRVRYFHSAHTMGDFTRSLCGVPAAGATLPVLAFCLLGIYGHVLPMLFFDTLLGIGHIGIHLYHRHQLRTA